MTLQETAVIEAMEIFKRQADDCVTSLYAYLTIRAVAAQSTPVRSRINDNALFWNTTLSALQSALILALGRVFETNTPHNVSTFMRAMNTNRGAFSRTSLRGRKALIFGADVGGLRQYMREACVPVPGDFRRVANFVKRHSNAYRNTYKDLRNQVFAHTLTMDHVQIAALFSKTNIREMQRMTTYLGHLHGAFWQALHNGGRLTVRPTRYSIARMLKRPKGSSVFAAIQEEVVSQTKRALQPWSPDAPPHRGPRRLGRH